MSGQITVQRAVDVVHALRSKGVRLWSEGGELRYRAPKGVLGGEDLDRLRTFRSQIAALLDAFEDTANAEPALRPRSHRDRAPLSFSQLAHWQLYRLGERPSMCLSASATRLEGPLDIHALRISLSEMIRRHEALRTRIVVCNGAPLQDISESRDCRLEVEDLSTLPEDVRDTEAQRAVERFILGPIDLAVDPLFRARVWKVDRHRHVLVMAMEHIITDAMSKHILLRDLFQVYEQIVGGRTTSLPAVTIQPADYAVWQRSALASWILRHEPYWGRRLAGCGRLRFSDDRCAHGGSDGLGTVPFDIGVQMKQKLPEWAKHRRTTVVMTVFTAFVALILRSGNVSDAVVRYQTNGRRPEIENTVGYFSSKLFLRVELRAEDRFVDLLRRVTEEYCNAHEHADSSYLESRTPQPEYARNSTFNWVPLPDSEEGFDRDRHERRIVLRPMSFEYLALKHLDVDFEPSIVLYDLGDRILGRVEFPAQRFSVPAMQRFARDFLRVIGALLRDPNALVRHAL